MLKKLRIKFIILNMATVAVVLVAVFTSVVLLNYQQAISSVTDSLDGAISRAADKQVKPASGAASEGSSNPGEVGAGEPKAAAPASGSSASSGGDAGDAGKSGSMNAAPTGVDDPGALADEAAGVEEVAAVAASSDDSAADAAEAAGAAEAASAADAADAASADSADESSGNSGSNYGTPPVIGGHAHGSSQSVPMAVFTVDADGRVSSVSTNTASISDDVLTQATAELSNAGEGSGTLADLGLIYMKRNMGGTMYLAFADTSNANGWQTLALTLGVVGVLTLLVFLVISVFFSRWALRPVANAWAQQRRFVADASHDLKTPLTVILANTSIALEHPERSVASQAQWLENTQHEAEAMQGLVGDLLTLAKMDEESAAEAASGAMGAAVPRQADEKVDFSDLVEGELLQFESVAFERGVDLRSDIAEGIVLMGNEKRLQRLVMTLIDNACKYVDESGSIDVSLSAQGKRVKLSVRNTGAPISPEDLPHVFDRFYRADKARTSGKGGHGLGLAIAHSIAEEHGGSLEVTSTESEGTVFSATLPIK